MPTLDHTLGDRGRTDLLPEVRRGSGRSPRRRALVQTKPARRAKQRRCRCCTRAVFVSSAGRLIEPAARRRRECHMGRPTELNPANGQLKNDMTSADSAEFSYGVTMGVNAII